MMIKEEAIHLFNTSSQPEKAIVHLARWLRAEGYGRVLHEDKSAVAKALTKELSKIYEEVGDYDLAFTKLNAKYNNLLEPHFICVCGWYVQEGREYRSSGDLEYRRRIEDVYGLPIDYYSTCGALYAIAKGLVFEVGMDPEVALAKILKNCDIDLEVFSLEGITSPRKVVAYCQK